MCKILQDLCGEKFEFYLADKKIIHWGDIWHKPCKMTDNFNTCRKKMNIIIEKKKHDSIKGMIFFWERENGKMTVKLLGIIMLPDLGNGQASEVEWQLNLGTFD